MTKQGFSVHRAIHYAIIAQHSVSLIHVFILHSFNLNLVYIKVKDWMKSSVKWSKETEEYSKISM